jgi:hypothetical protein
MEYFIFGTFLVVAVGIAILPGRTANDEEDNFPEGWL